MSLNIKNEETHRLVRDLAALTGETLTGAVTVAVRERYDRLNGAAGSTAEDLLRIGQDVATRLSDSWEDEDPTAKLYDDRGLPA